MFKSSRKTKSDNLELNALYNPRKIKHATNIAHLSSNNINNPNNYNNKKNGSADLTTKNDDDDDNTLMDIVYSDNDSVNYDSLIIQSSSMNINQAYNKADNALLPNTVNGLMMKCGDIDDEDDAEDVLNNGRIEDYEDDNELDHDNDHDDGDYRNNKSRIICHVDSECSNDGNDGGGDAERDGDNDGEDNNTNNDSYSSLGDLCIESKDCMPTKDLEDNSYITPIKDIKTFYESWKSNDDNIVNNNNNKLLIPHDTSNIDSNINNSNTNTNSNSSTKANTRANIDPDTNIDTGTSVNINTNINSNSNSPDNNSHGSNNSNSDNIPNTNGNPDIDANPNSNESNSYTSTNMNKSQNAITCDNNPNNDNNNKNNLNEKQLESSIIEILDCKYIPDNIQYRENEMHKINEFIYRCITKKSYDNLFISGNPGSGKTIVVNDVLDKIQKKGYDYIFKSKNIKKVNKLNTLDRYIKIYYEHQQQQKEPQKELQKKPQKKQQKEPQKNLEKGQQQYKPELPIKADERQEKSKIFSELYAKKSFNIIRLNAMIYKNRLDIYGSIYKDLVKSSKYENIPITSVNLPKLLNDIKNFMKNNKDDNVINIIFIDEIDSLFTKLSLLSTGSSSHIIHDILNIFKLSKYRHSNTILIGISNTIEVIISLNQKYQFANKIHSVVFAPYTWYQIFNILLNRLKYMVNNSQQKQINSNHQTQQNEVNQNLYGFFDEFSLKYCAKKIYAIKGSDIRCVLDLLKNTFLYKLMTFKNQLNPIEANQFNISSGLSISLILPNNEIANKDITTIGNCPKAEIKVSIDDINKIFEEYYGNSHLIKVMMGMPRNQQMLLLSIYLYLDKQTLDIMAINSKDILYIYNSICQTEYLSKISHSDMNELLLDFESYKLINMANNANSNSDNKNKAIIPIRSWKKQEFILRITKQQIKKALENIPFFQKYFDTKSHQSYKIS